MGREGIWNALTSFGAIEAMLPVLLTQVSARAKPAKSFNLHPKKGVIQLGSDADLVIVDINGTATNSIVNNRR